MIWTASPGISRIIRNVSTETPNATVSSSPPRLTAAPSTLLPDAHLAQAAQAACRVRLVGLDVVADGGEQRAVGEVHDRALAGKHLLRLVIQPLALGRLTRGAGLGEDLVQLRVAVFEHVGCAAGAERPAEIVVRVGAAAVQAGEGLEVAAAPILDEAPLLLHVE